LYSSTVKQINQSKREPEFGWRKGLNNDKVNTTKQRKLRLSQVGISLDDGKEHNLPMHVRKASLSSKETVEDKQSLSVKGNMAIAEATESKRDIRPYIRTISNKGEHENTRPTDHRECSCDVNFVSEIANVSQVEHLNKELSTEKTRKLEVTIPIE
jgi:hypothetical protein